MVHTRLFAIGIVALAGCTVGVAAGPAQTKPPAQAAKAPKAAPKLSWPAPVEAAFKKAYPNATVKVVSKETENGKVQYEVESMDGSQARDLIYLADGTLVLYEELVPQADVPAPVMTALKAKYPKATITRAEKLFQNGTMNYELVLKGQGPAEVVLTPAGKWVSPAK